MADLRVLLCDDDPDLLGLLVWRLLKVGSALDRVSDGPSQISPRAKGSLPSWWAVTGGLEQGL